MRKLRIVVAEHRMCTCGNTEVDSRLNHIFGQIYLDQLFSWKPLFWESRWLTLYIQRIDTGQLYLHYNTWSRGLYYTGQRFCYKLAIFLHLCKWNFSRDDLPESCGIVFQFHHLHLNPLNGCTVLSRFENPPWNVCWPASQLKWLNEWHWIDCGGRVF